MSQENKMQIQTVISLTLFFLALALIGCSLDEMTDNDGLKTKEIDEAQILQMVTITHSPTSTELELSVYTPIPTPANEPTPEIVVSNIITKRMKIEPQLVATIRPTHYRYQSSVPGNVWWSGDSQILYFQDSEIQKAWAFDLLTGQTNNVPYVIAHSFHEVEAQIVATLPENAEFFSFSPSTKKILYRTRLPKPVPNPEFSNDPDYPSYTDILWLRQDGQDIQLGLVDACFGILVPPKWSANENIAIVNNAGAPGIRCLHSSWLIDFNALSVGALETPWEGVRSYWVSDLSADGNLLLIRAEINYFYNRKTNEQWPIPGVDTNNIILLESKSSLICLFLDAEFENNIFHYDISYCKPIQGKASILTTIDGRIVSWVISPNRKFIAFIVDGQNPVPNPKDTLTGIWLLSLTQR